MDGNVQGPSVQAGSIHGPVVFNGAADRGGPGLVSLAAPVERLVYEVHGRDELVGAVVDQVRSGRSCTVLHGAGGYGKTTAALRVVESVAADTEVWWVDASSEESVRDGLREVALRAGASAEEVRQAWEGQASAPDLLWRQLNRRTARWLLVFDNADDTRILGAGQPVSDGTGWLRAPGSGAVLVTSRDAGSWGRSARLHAVGQLPDPDGARMLLDRAPAAGSVEQAEELSRRLGGLPLALHSAGRYLAVAGKTPALPGLELPRDFDGYRAALDDRWPEVTDLPGHQEREILSRTWELSLDLLAERGQPLARQLLRLLSHFAAAPIPQEVLHAEVLAESPLFDGLTVHHLALLISALESVGLVQTGVEGQEVPVLRLHPVVREANLNQGDAAESSGYAELCEQLLVTCAGDIDQIDHITWSRWIALLPHCLRAVELATTGDGDEEDQPRFSDITWLCELSADFCCWAGLYGLAHDLFLTALSRRRATADDRDAGTLSTRLNLAGVLRVRGALAEAEAEYRVVLAAHREVLGERHPDILMTRHNLALVLLERGALAEAEAECRVVLAARREVFGERHPHTLATRNNLALMMRERGEFDEAETELRSVLDLHRKVLGEDHPDTLVTEKDLNDLLSRRNQD
ncbi:hypothetical protein GCM10010470_56270 [Saccharopolyspora taberi]|uniref:ORC1/DEAH AAA+ ATPase domain-containing protein n=2 Tax=Saccharopolyspora taberi TaxID=60895 RepID=A0ABN3VMF9_9PSEU